MAKGWLSVYPDYVPRFSLSILSNAWQTSIPKNCGQQAFDRKHAILKGSDVVCDVP
jgi:hypothetical protein